MKKLTVLLAFVAVSYASAAQNKTYYVKPTGNDANSGLTISAAWQTLSKLSSTTFYPGDSILLEGGQVFTGTLHLQNEDQGLASNPIVITSYGIGKAIIDAGGMGNGVFAYNTGGIEIRNLMLYSSGPTANNHNGVEFYMDQTSARISHIYIDSVEVYGFGSRGIIIGAWGTDKGYDNVRITRSAAHDNGHNGIETYGNWPDYSHKNFYIGYCKAYNNFGRSDFTSKHSGSGIIVSGVDTAMIEYCEAYSNGKFNGHVGGGPVGIWFYDTKNGVIQFSESHHNEAGLDADGGGFDIDGGSQNCIIQYCYSHDNEGAGYGMFEYGSPNPFINNVIRYNISQNDGRKNGYGALGFWGADDSHKLINCSVYNNTLYVSNSGATQAPCIAKFIGNSMDGLKISNNIFYITGGVDMIRAAAPIDTFRVHFKNNNYYSTNGVSTFSWNGSIYTSLSSWKANASGQEMEGLQSLGTTADPLFVNPGQGQVIHPADGGNLASVVAYQIQPSSGAIDAGINLQSYGIDVGDRDFYNNALYSGSTFEIGANEFNSNAAVLPLHFLNFEAEVNNKVLITRWLIEHNNEAERFVVETSTNGSNFVHVTSVNATSSTGLASYTNRIGVTNVQPTFCRIKAIYKTGSHLYSAVRRLDEVRVNHSAELFPNPVVDKLNIQLPVASKHKYVEVRNAFGLVLSKQNIIQGQNLSLDFSSYSSGIYFVELGSETAKEQFKIIKR